MRKTVFAAALSAAGMVIFAGALPADTLTLRNGQVVTGTYMGGTAREVRMDTGRDRLSVFAVDQVSGIQFDGNGPDPNQTYNTAPPQPPVDNSNPAVANNSAPPPGYSNTPPPQYNSNVPPPAYNNNVPPPAYANNSNNNGGYTDPNAANATNGTNNYPPQGITLSAGTNIVVRMLDAVDSDSSRLGQTYRASLDEPIVVDGQTIVPRGADVVTKIVEDRQAGKFEGRTSIGLALQSISINGRFVDVSSQDVREQSGNRGARSAGVIGGGTVLGAIIGGIAGGGKGAAIGALSGAALGTGAQAVTRGERVKVPVETRLTFTLTNPVSF